MAWRQSLSLLRPSLHPSRPGGCLGSLSKPFMCCMTPCTPHRTLWSSSLRREGFRSSHRLLVAQTQPVVVQQGISPSSTFLAGLLGGVMGSLAGVGGGIVMIPLLTRMGASQFGAQTSSLAAVVATTSFGALALLVGGGEFTSQKEHEPTPVEGHVGVSETTTRSSYGGDGVVIKGQDKVNIAAALSIAVFAMPMASYGAKKSASLPVPVMKSSIGVLMVVGGLMMPVKKYLLPPSPSASPPRPQLQLQDASLLSKVKTELSEMEVSEGVVYATIGVISGALAGLVGVGGGTLITPSLALFTAVDQQTAVGTSLLAMLPGAVTALITQFKLGNIQVRMAGPLAVGAGIGSVVGARYLLSYFDEDTLRIICASAMIPAGIKMALRI